MIQRYLSGVPADLAATLSDRSEPPFVRDAEDRGRRKKKRYRSIWISDLHLGTRGCNADLLLDFLRNHKCDHLYLVGDIVDGWRLKRSWYWNEDQNRVVKEILHRSHKGTKVHYICGNHDEFLRDYVGLVFGGVTLEDEVVHRCADGRRLLVMHGDRFDVCIRNAKWLAFLGDHAYAVCLTLNTVLNRIRRRFGYGYWSLSAYLKRRVKNAVSFVGKFEEVVAAETRSRGFDGVVCGHIHQAEMREVDGVLYCNDGDWVESCTALVEDYDGSLEIIHWADVVEARRLAERRRPVEEERAERTPVPAG